MKPYEAFAWIYDEVMSHIDYPAWVAFALNVLRDHGLPSPGSGEVRILECGAGTGTAAIILALEGYRVHAFDSSPSMIEVAGFKTRGMKNSPDLRVMDFLELNSVGSYHAVLCLFDSVNYLVEPAQVVDFFRRVRDALAPEGLFLFDVCTEINSILYFDDRCETRSGEGFDFRRRMRYFSDAGIQENLITIRFDGHPDELLIERHHQRIYPIEVMRAYAGAAGLTILEEMHEFERRPPEIDALRVHFLCTVE